jgi:small-conductance mechanosensitive channel
MFQNTLNFIGILVSTGIALFDYQIAYLVLSVVISVGLFFLAKTIVQKKLGDLKGSSKLLGLILVAIGAGEIFYLGINFGMFTLAVEIIAYLGIGIWIILIPFQSHLKNMASGISNFINTEMNIGDIVEIKGKRGVIVDFHLTKTFLLTEKGERVSIPNYRFHEDVVIIYPKHTKSSNVSDASKTEIPPPSERTNFKN